MAAIDFDNSPSNGDTVVANGVTYTYDSTAGKWKTTINSNAFLPLSGGTVTGNILMGGEIQHEGDTDTKIHFDTNEINFDTGGSTRATIDSSGHLLVGGTTAGNAATRTVSIGSPGATTGGLQLWSTTSGTSYVQFGDATGSASDHYRGAMGYEHNNDALIFFSAGTERSRITSTGDFRFNSGFGSVATAYGCRAWVNFNGKAASIGSGRANGNVSSVADNGTGQYTVNFSNSFPDNDYAVAQFCRADSGGGMRVAVGRGTTGFANGSIQIEVRNGSNNNEDVDVVCLAFFR